MRRPAKSSGARARFRARASPATNRGATCRWSSAGTSALGWCRATTRISSAFTSARRSRSRRRSSFSAAATSSTSITTRRSPSIPTTARSSGTTSISTTTGISTIRSSACSSTRPWRRIRVKSRGSIRACAPASGASCACSHRSRWSRRRRRRDHRERWLQAHDAPRGRARGAALRRPRTVRGVIRMSVWRDDLILVSVDDHICEPADMFEAHVPAKYRDSMPRVVDEADGSQQWFYGDLRGRNLGLNAVAGKPPEMFNVNPNRYEEMRPGCYDVDERVRDMSAGGQLAGLNFPNWTGFSGQVLNAGPDRGVDLVMIKAYNDWHVDEWCGAYPERFIPCGILPLFDVEAAADEVRRLDAKGCHAVTFS